jgi:chaperone BCS1
MFDSIAELVRENQIMQGGALLIVWGALLAYFRHIPGRIFSFISRRLIIKVDIPDSDLAFSWINLWLAEQSTLRKTRLLTAGVVREDGTPAAAGDLTHGTAVPDSKKATRRIVFSPAPGAHLLLYRGRIAILQRVRRELESNFSNRAYQETFIIRMLTRDRGVIQKLLEEARDLALPPEDTRIEILEVEYDRWRHMTYRNPRDPESVILPGNTVHELLDDVQNFLNSRSWYDQRGIPYRRGYLLEGPPGTGKTSLVTAIATAVELNVCVLSLSSTSMSDDVLRRLMGDMPFGSILLLEDIDALFDGRDAAQGTARGITFSGLLNAIDGIATKDGRILFMTSNRPEKLDSALIRPGRVDRRYKLTWACPEQAERLFLRFFHDNAETQSEAFKTNGLEGKARAFGAKVGGKQISMAALQGYLLEYRNDPIKAEEDIDRSDIPRPVIIFAR